LCIAFEDALGAGLVEAGRLQETKRDREREGEGEGERERMRDRERERETERDRERERGRVWRTRLRRISPQIPAPKPSTLNTKPKTLPRAGTGVPRS